MLCELSLGGGVTTRMGPQNTLEGSKTTLTMRSMSLRHSGLLQRPVSKKQHSKAGYTVSIK